MRTRYGDDLVDDSAYNDPGGDFDDDGDLCEHGVPFFEDCDDCDAEAIDDDFDDAADDLEEIG